MEQLYIVGHKDTDSGRVIIDYEAMVDIENKSHTGIMCEVANHILANKDIGEEIDKLMDK